MTTLVGIVLASDVAGTSSNWTAQGDVAYRRQERTEGQKIYVDKKGEVAVCMSGVFDSGYTSFLSKIINGEIDLRKATGDGFLEELLRLNLSRWNHRMPENDIINALLIATRFDNDPKLYTAWPLGKVEQRVVTSIGSGSEYALKHIHKQRRLIPDGTTISQAVDLAQEAIEESSQDVYTSGLDIVVATEDKISTFGDMIKGKVNSAKKAAIEDVKKSIGQQ